MSQIEHSAHLLIKTEGDRILGEYTLDKSPLTIGRATHRDISLSGDKLISRRHLVVSWAEGNYSFLDEGSANGTLLNGVRVDVMQSYPLQFGDQISLGHYLLIFLPGPATTPMQKDALSSRPLPQPSTNSQVTSANPVLPVFTRQTTNAALDHLRFTAYYAAEAFVGEWSAILLYAHTEENRGGILQDLARFYAGVQEEPVSPKTNTKPWLPGDLKITLVPECPGVSFNPKRLTLQWNTPLKRVEFRFTARPELADQIARGHLNIFFGPLLMATLPLEIIFREPGNVLTLPPREETTSLHQKIYTAYSLHEKQLVQACQNVYQLLGLKSLININMLRASQNFSATIQQLIETSDVFQLFWSPRTSWSLYVKQEWEYALQLQRGESFIKPVYWNLPMHPAPEQLEGIPFSYLPPYTFDI